MHTIPYKAREQTLYNVYVYSLKLARRYIHDLHTWVISPFFSSIVLYVTCLCTLDDVEYVTYSFDFFRNYKTFANGCYVAIQVKYHFKIIPCVIVQMPPGNLHMCIYQFIVSVFLVKYVDNSFISADYFYNCNANLV